MQHVVSQATVVWGEEVPLLQTSANSFSAKVPVVIGEEGDG